MSNYHDWIEHLKLLFNKQSIHLYFLKDHFVIHLSNCLVLLFGYLISSQYHNTAIEILSIAESVNSDLQLSLKNSCHLIMH